MAQVLLIILCCFFHVSIFSNYEEAKEEFFLSTPEQIATLSCEPSYLIGGVVNPLSGSPHLRQTDFIVKGAESIALSRTYISPHMPCRLGVGNHLSEEWEKYYLFQHLAHNYKGWQFYPHLKLHYTPSQRQVLLTDTNGTTLRYSFRGPGIRSAKLDGELYGLSNASGETPSGKYDPRNTRIQAEEGWQKITVFGIDRTTRFYRLSNWISKETQLFLLEKEILPNGKILKYHYEKGQPSYIESLDPQERFVYASIRIHGNPWVGKCNFTTSLGQTADYQYHRRPIHAKIIKETKHWYGTDQYSAEYNLLCPPILAAVSSPNYRKEQLEYCDRFLLQSYHGKANHFKVVNNTYGEGTGYHRVHQLFLPVGENDAFVPVYELAYQPPIAGVKEGKTVVLSSDGTSIVYHFSKNLLTTAIQYFGKDGKLKKEKRFLWSENHYLKSIALRDGENILFYEKSFEYDRFGNPIFEIFTGDLSGSGDLDSIWIKRIFSTDGKNLLLEEETENGKRTSFSYLKDTDLITAKLISDNNKIQRREFYNYDDCHNLIELILDDGSGRDVEDLSGMTERRTTTYILRQSAPFLHMPEWVIQTYTESGVEKPLSKSHLIYDKRGNIEEEEVYDVEENLAYTIYKTYNERGDLLSETNPLGQKAIYTYDDRGKLKTKTNHSGRIHQTLSYDARGRLCNVMAEGEDGIHHSTASKYDFSDRMVKSTDPFGNSAYYKYDPIVNEVIQTEFSNVSTFSTYDPFGRKLSHTDANGNKNRYRYNVYGSISEIVHPNGGKETFRYDKNGDLILYTNLDGVTIHYENDVFRRVLKKYYFSQEGMELAQEAFGYSGFRLLYETDKEGNRRCYLYDGAGRKVQDEFCGTVSEFAYDALGRVSAIHKKNGDNTLIIHYERDLKNQIVVERKTDQFGNIFSKVNYSYDADGNRSGIKRFINGEEAQESFAYDSFQRMVCKRDPKGYETQISYNENYLNDLGQKVLQMKKVDPNGIATTKLHDVFSRIVQIERCDVHGKAIACQNMTYDPHGNLSSHNEHIYENGKYQSTQNILFTYTDDHQVKSIIRGFATPNERQTSYSYFPSGKLEKKTLSCGMHLLYNYDSLGFLRRIDSSDGSICHAFIHNNLGFLLEAVDEKQNIIIHREVDPFGNVIRELLPNNYEVVKLYDNYHRPLLLEIRGQALVRYSYDPLFLRGVERVASDGIVLYKHTFEEYDLSGNLKKELLIGELGAVSHITDVRGEKNAIITPYFSQEYKYDAVSNLSSSTIDGATTQYTYDDTFQLMQEENTGGINTYCNDSLYNRIQKDEDVYQVNSLNELLFDGKSHYEYDLRGNRVLKKTGSEQIEMLYDLFDQLIEFKSQERKVEFTYDPLGRRVTKTVSVPTGSSWVRVDQESYLYDGQNEIGSIKESNTLQNFRVLTPHSLPKTLAIEIGDKIYAPLIDVQGNIRRLIDVKTKDIAARYDFTPFGQRISSYGAEIENPWQFASKRFDPHLDLVYFGKRYYDPNVGRWLTTDPAGNEDSANLYQYALNNPFRYYDPNGENLGGYLLGLGEIALGGALILTGGVIEIGSFGTLTIGFAIAEASGFALVGHGLALTTQHAQDLRIPNILWKNTDVYAPDRPLPRHPRTGEPVPDSDAPHTQLGTRDGTKGKYPQAREFDAQGKPVKDIDFTDHDKPKKHPNPHQHKYKPNATGGTPERSSKAEPVENYNYSGNKK